MLDVVTELCTTHRLREDTFAAAHTALGDEAVTELVMWPLGIVVRQRRQTNAAHCAARRSLKLRPCLWLDLWEACDFRYLNVRVLIGIVT